MKVDSVFIEKYCENQNQGLSAFVNFGLLVLILFDYIGKKRNKSKLLSLYIILAMACIGGVYFHTGIYSKGLLSSYVAPISYYQLSYWFHTIFFIILLIIKIDTMKEPLPIKYVQEEY